VTGSSRSFLPAGAWLPTGMPVQVRDLMLRMLDEVWRARELLGVLIEREIKTRYRRSFLGLLWSLLTPLYQVLFLTIVVKVLWQHPEPNYSVKYLCGLVPWTFMQQGVLTSCASLLRARDIVKRVWLPRQLIPLATVGSCLFHLLASVAVLYVILAVIPLVLGGPHVFGIAHVFLIPLVLLEVIMVAGLALLFSALHTFHNDVEYILTNLLMTYLFLTPVIYPLSWVPDNLQSLVMFNPMATICEGFRGVVLRHELPDPAHLVSLAVVAFGCLFVGLWAFRRRAWKFPEVM
jgi:lipopolysaccharide transport system permease protein